MHDLGIIAFDKIWFVAVAGEEVAQLVVADARQHRRIGDLVAVQMQDWQHRAVSHGIQELIREPARRERPRLRFTVADDAGGDELGIVEDRSVRVDERVSELAALVN